MLPLSETSAPPEGPLAPIPTDPQSLFLMEIVGELGIPIGFEQSFRVSKSAIHPNRFALWIDKNLVPEKPREKILAICRRMRMPPGFVAAMLDKFEEAQGVLLGCERGETSCVYKVYLDMREKIAKPQGPDPVLIFEAYKWDVADPARRMVTTYQGYPWLRADGMLERISRMYDQRCPECFQIIWSIAQRAAAKGGGEDLRYMEVTEANGRASFVFNLYPAKMTMGELAPDLRRIARHFAIVETEFQSAIQPLAAKRPGWLGGGIHRDGQEFMSVYYGWEWWRYDLFPVASATS